MGEETDDGGDNSRDRSNTKYWEEEKDEDNGAVLTHDMLEFVGQTSG